MSARHSSSPVKAAQFQPPAHAEIVQPPIDNLKKADAEQTPPADAQGVLSQHSNEESPPGPTPSSPQPSDATDATEVPRTRPRMFSSFSDIDQPIPSSSRLNGNGHVRRKSGSPRRERQPEDGWDDSTPSEGVVLTYESPCSEVERSMFHQKSYLLCL
jgi:hypothetical protein